VLEVAGTFSKNGGVISWLPPLRQWNQIKAIHAEKPNARKKYPALVTLRVCENNMK